MKRLLAGSALGFLALTAVGSMAWSYQAAPSTIQPITVTKKETNTKSLPVTKAVLYTNGVGYFEREGTLPGGSDIEITCRLGEVNDLLKSLTVQDLDGGKAGTVTLASPSDPESATAGLENFLEGNPTWQEILLLARGTQVEVTLDPPTAAAAVPAPVTGIVISLEVPAPQRQVEVISQDNPPTPAGGLGYQHRESTVPVKYQVFDASVVQQRMVLTNPLLARLQLLTAQGYVTIKLDQIRQVKLLDAPLEQRIRQAMSKVQRPFEALGNQLTSVRLHINGEGQRRIRIGYLREQPLWKTCYRLMLDQQNQAQLQGWAIVENTSDEDWQQIQLKLVAGQPVSFRMDLHTTLQPTRPEAMVPSYKPFLPRGYQALFDRQSGPVANLPELGTERMDMAKQSRPLGMGGMGGGMGGMGGGMGGMGGLGGMGGGLGGMPANRDRGEGKPADQQAGQQSAPLGSYFEYTIAEPVSLQQGKTTMVPMLQMAIPAERLSLYQADEPQAKALLALRLRNESKTLLAAGPISLFENRQFVGEAQLPEVAIGAKTFLTYGVDAALSIKPLPPRTTVRPTEVELHYATLTGFTAKVVEETSRTYQLHNRNADARRVLIEQRRAENSKLIKPAESLEGDESHYRFSTEVKPSQRGNFEVITSAREECDQSNQSTKQTIKVDDLGQVFVNLEELPIVPGNVSVNAGYLVISNKLQRRYRYTLQALEKDWSGILRHTVDHTWSAPQLPATGKLEADTIVLPVAVKSKSTITVEVQQEKPTVSTTKLSKLNASELRSFIASYDLPAGLKPVLEQALEVQVRKAQLGAEQLSMEERLKEIDQEQTRLRANMKDLPKDAPLYKRYLDKFDKQEQEIDETRAKLKQHRQVMVELEGKLVELERGVR